MNTDKIEFEIIVDTSGTPFNRDDVYDVIESYIRSVPGWENSIADNEIEAHPVAAFGPEALPVISLIVAGTGLTYNVVRNFFKDRADKKSTQVEHVIKEKQIKLQQKEIKLLEELSMKLDKLEVQLRKYGRVRINIK